MEAFLNSNRRNRSSVRTEAWKRDILTRYNENYNVLNKFNIFFKVAKLRKNITEIGFVDVYLKK